jgi:hypothetical protein
MSDHQKRLLRAVNGLNDSDPMNCVGLAMACACAKMDMGAGLKAAVLLQARGLLKVERSTRLEENRLHLTETGVEVAERLRLPVWRRWASDRVVVQPLVIGVFGAVIGAFGRELAQHLVKLLPW